MVYYVARHPETPGYIKVVALVVRPTPTLVITAAQEKAKRASEKTTSYRAAAGIVALWGALLYLGVCNLLK